MESDHQSDPTLVPLAVAVWSRVAHDLRQPIQALLLLTHIVALTDEPQARLATSHSMEAALLSLQAMLTELSELAQLDMQARARAPQPVDLCDIVSGALTRLTNCAEKHRIHVTTRYSPAPARADADLVAVLVTGLLRSAIQSAVGDVITIHSGTAGDTSFVEIHFSGPPLSPTHRNAIFIELPHATNPLAPYRTATGLGLLKMIADRLGATIGDQFSSPDRHRLSLTFRNKKQALRDQTKAPNSTSSKASKRHRP